MYFSTLRLPDVCSPSHAYESVAKPDKRVEVRHRERPRPSPGSRINSRRCADSPLPFPLRCPPVIRPPIGAGRFANAPNAEGGQPQYRRHQPRSRQAASPSRFGRGVTRELMMFLGDRDGLPFAEKVSAEISVLKENYSLE